MRRVGSILGFLCAGFFLFCIEACMAIRLPDGGGWAHLIEIMIFGVPFVGFLILGLAMRSFHSWMRWSGTVLLVTNGNFAFMAFTFACLLHSSTINTLESSQEITHLRDSYADWPLSAVAALFVTVVGALLFYHGDKTDDRDC